MVAEDRTSGEGDQTKPSSLFEGKQFWLSQNVPQRTRFRDIIRQHGGTIRLYEKDADIKLVDHARKNLPSDTYSYRYVEQSVRNGKLEDLEKHRAGPSSARPVGATNIPTRSHRFPYTLNDDQILWDWMEPYELNLNAPVSGNKIYQELAAEHPQHTYQSWRERYLKKLRGRPRPGGERESKLPPLTGENTREELPAQKAENFTEPHKEHQKIESSYYGLEDRKRKRTPAVDDIDHDDHSVDVSQKRRAAYRTPPHPKRVIHDTPDCHNSPGDVVPADSEINVAGDPDMNKQGANESQVSPPQTTNPEDLVDPLFLELPFLPQSPDSGHEGPPAQDIDAWIDDRLRLGKAANVEQVVEALHCTSMDPDLADKVLEFLIEGKSIPDDMPGVWTAEDDGCIESEETRPIQQLLEKHGWASFDARWEYLGLAKAAGLNSTDN
ncbi:TRF2-interacting telomeric protein/Rap1 C terminal domain-containing protein [Aspergillus avenaceus]|uniref:DNA-binding protein RAP1 n=1 Tax=Aspergillus avenaceus TaxID=36643 RepID=A0A5N6TY09_ASPAV|nr:TRF2-interacting telomeric protein/Rap1 C terminal domain-containing protein [Aspergillus avenaceus]